MDLYKAYLVDIWFINSAWKFQYHMQLVLQPTARVKGSQKSLKDLLAMQQKQGSVLQIVSIFLINQLKKC